jgi:hypothetical protein
VTDPGNPGQPYGGYNNPYNPQGGNPPGGNPYAPQGGEAPGPTPYGAPGPTPYGAPGPPPPPAPKKGAGRLVGILVGVAVLLLALCGGGAYLLSTMNKDAMANAKAGDCIHSSSVTSTTAQKVTDTKVVKCDAADANYKVVGIVKDKTETQFTIDDKICDAYPTAETAIWQGKTGSTGSVFCLAPNTK